MAMSRNVPARQGVQLEALSGDIFPWTGALVGKFREIIRVGVLRYLEAFERKTALL